MAVEWAAIGILLTLSSILGTVIFHMGRLSNRVENLEKWKLTVRDDMHEISDILTNMKTELERLSTLIEERTDRRFLPRK